MYLQQHLLCKDSIYVRMCFLYVQMCDLCQSIEGIRLKSPPTCKTFFPLLLWTLRRIHFEASIVQESYANYSQKIYSTFVLEN